MGRIEGKLIVVFLAVMFTVAVMTMWPALIKEWGYTGRADSRVMGMETHVSTHMRSSVHSRRLHEVTRYTYAPVVEFTSDSGEVIRGEYVATNPPMYKEGDVVFVKYDKHNPHNWTLKGNWVTTFGVIFFTVVTCALWMLVMFYDRLRGWR